MPRIRRNTAKTGLAIVPDRKFVTALGRGLDVLRCFGPRDRWLANQEIAARTGLARPTVSRLVYTLTQLGFLRPAHRPPKYALGRAVSSVATPIDPRDRTKPMVIGCSGAAFQLGPDLLKRDIGPRLLALVGNLRSSIQQE